MKVIVIQDKDAQALLDQLKLTSFTIGRSSTVDVEKLEQAGVPNAQRVVDSAIAELHRAFHYRVTCWLQDHGAEGLHS